MPTVICGWEKPLIFAFFAFVILAATEVKNFAITRAVSTLTNPEDAKG